jgi:hypothetical protein
LPPSPTSPPHCVACKPSGCHPEATR